MPIIIYKQQGETPLETLDRLRKEKPELRDEKLSYAGRLDPMAEGVMVVLVGDENKPESQVRQGIIGLDKTYRTEILFGLQTDTGDCLGKIVAESITQGESRISKEKVKNALATCIGKVVQKYPQFSSKVFARRGSFEEVREEVENNINKSKSKEISHEVEIYAAELIEMKSISGSELLARVERDISRVKGDFRQEEILIQYREIFSQAEMVAKIFSVAELRLNVSSGFYVRQFAEDLGALMETPAMPALAMSIIREKVGEWSVKDCCAYTL